MKTIGRQMKRRVPEGIVLGSNLLTKKEGSKRRLNT